MVEFCDKCNNLFTYTNDKDGLLIHKCNVCGHTSELVDNCIFINILKSDQQDYTIKRNMIYDNTLARSVMIKCPNPDCTKGEVIIFNYNPDKLNTGFMCSVCYTYWKN